MVIGTWLNIWLQGFSFMQSYVYFRRFPKDRGILKALVAFLLVADTLNSILDCHFTYTYSVTHYGDYNFLSQSVHTFSSDPVMTGLISSTTQAFFGWRVMKLSHSVAIASLIWFLAAVQFLASIGTTVAVTIVQYFVDFHKFGFMVTIWLAGSACADLAITITLVYQLSKSRTGFAATDDLISRLVRLTLQTGLITTTFAIIDLILFQAFTNNLHLIFNLPLAKLYTNSLLSTLNARAGGWSTGISLPDEESSASRVISGARTTGQRRKSNFQLTSSMSARGGHTSSAHRGRGFGPGGRSVVHPPTLNLEGGITVVEEEMVRESSMDLDDRKAMRAGLSIGAKEVRVTGGGPSHAGTDGDGEDDDQSGRLGVSDNLDTASEPNSPYYATHQLGHLRQGQAQGGDVHGHPTH